jgi:protein TonB
MPQFPGGENALMKWINDHMNYPTIAAENGISGRVNCTFVVNADGSVVDVEVVRGRDPYLDKEAVRVLKLLPKFKPGEQRGKPVRVKYNVPVYFQLR